MYRSEELDPELQKVESLISQARPKSVSLDPMQMMYHAGWDAAVATQNAIDSQDPSASEDGAGRVSPTRSPLGSRRKQNRINNADSSNFRLQLIAGFSSIAAMLMLGLFLMQSLREPSSDPFFMQVQTKSTDPISEYQNHISGLGPSHTGVHPSRQPITGSMGGFQPPRTRRQDKNRSKRLIQELDETFGVPEQRLPEDQLGPIPKKNR